MDEAAASRGLSGDQDTGEMARYIVSVIERDHALPNSPRCKRHPTTGGSSEGRCEAVISKRNVDKPVNRFKPSGKRQKERINND